MNARIEKVDASSTRALRHAVLRRGHPASSTVYLGDDDPRTAHFALRLPDAGESGEVVAVGTVMPDAPPWDLERPNAWRIRGMATQEGLRGHGYGTVVLDALTEHARSSGGDLIWCHARVGALDFYRRGGFEAIGGPFDDGIAMHQSMWRPLP